MIQVTPNPRISTQSNETKACTCLLVVYKCFQICFGIDFGFFRFKNYRMKVLFKILAIFQCIIVIFFSTIQIDYSDSLSVFWYSTFLFQYLICALIATFTKDGYTFYKHIHDIKVNYNTFSLEVKLLLSVLLCFLYRSSLIVGFCYNNSNLKCLGTFSTSFVFSLLLLATDVIIITHTFMFLVINSSLKFFASELKSYPGFNIVSKQRLFKSIIDVAEQHKSAFDPVLLSLNMSVGLIVATEIMILTFMPAISAGLISAKVEKIKVILHETLQNIRDESRVQEMERFIRYVEARPCRFRVYMVIPLNADLLGLVFSFSATYLIVIIQFTHLY